MQSTYEAEMYEIEDAHYHDNDYEDIPLNAFPHTPMSGAQRVLRLVLILLVLILVSAIFFFVLLPVIQSITQAPPPALAPALQV